MSFDDSRLAHEPPAQDGVSLPDDPARRARGSPPNIADTVERLEAERRRLQAHTDAMNQIVAEKRRDAE